jgi:hypothetical protein
MRPTTCARPGCPASASAWLTYDYAAQLVWLDDRAGGDGDQWGLCSAHAARLSAPRGWSAVDRRVGRPGPTTLVS